MDDAKDPASLLIAGRNQCHAQSGDGPEGHNSNRRADSVGGDLHARTVSMHHSQPQNSGDNDRESDAPIENKIDAIALHAQQALTDEVKDRAANRMCGSVWHGEAYAAAGEAQLRLVRVPGPSTSWRTLRV